MMMRQQNSVVPNAQSPSPDLDLTAKINGPNGTQKRKAIIGSMAKIQESA